MSGTDGKRVLLADDDDANALTFAALLEDCGFAVEAVGSFADARRRIDVSGARYDVVLVDYHLQDGLGTDLVEAVRARHPSAKVILMSGSIGGQTFDHEADGYFPKGEDFADLLALIERALGSTPTP